MIMKKFLLIMLGLLPLSCYMQAGNDNFVVEGKTWTIFSYSLLAEYRHTYQMQLKSDTVIDGLTYKKLYRYDKGTVTYEGAFREDGDKVYYKEEGRSEACFYDFGLNVGDSLAGYRDDFYGDLTVISKESQEYCGQQRSTMVLGYDGNESYNIQWVSGVGSLSRPDINVVLVGNDDMLLYCTVNSDTIYKCEASLIAANTVSAKVTESATDGKMYDISGRSMSVKPEKGFYIKNKRKYTSR